MTKHCPVLLRNYFGQIEFQLYRVSVFGQSQSAAKANNVRIAGYSRYPERIAEDAVGGFPAHARKPQELFHRIGDFAAVLIDDFRAGAFDISGFIAKKARAFYVRFYLL